VIILREIGMVMVFTGGMLFLMSFVMFRPMTKIDDEDRATFKKLLGAMKLAARAVSATVLVFGAALWYFWG